MVNIRSRKSWGARHANGDKTLSGLADGVFIHHTVTATLPASASVAEEEAQMRSVESIGQSRFGTGISYNVIIFPSGRAYQGVTFNRRGTHTGGMNSTVRSICFAGNFEENKPTDAAIDTARAIYSQGEGKWWDRGAPVRPHGDVSQTACPGKHVKARLGDIRKGGDSSTPARPSKPGKLTIDGWIGPDTIRALQRAMGTTVDGVVSSQPITWRSRMPAVTGGFRWTAAPRGSSVIMALQRKIGARADGMIGPATIRALQRELSVKADGYAGRVTGRALQRALNDGDL